jgi:hypothetical protein
MILVGCDLDTCKQQVALLNTDTGERRDQELSHVGDDVERFYAALSPPVTVGIESTGYSLWFHALLRAPGPYAPRRRGREDPSDGGAQNQNRSPRCPAPPGPPEGQPLPRGVDSRSDDARPARAAPPGDQGHRSMRTAVESRHTTTVPPAVTHQPSIRARGAAHDVVFDRRRSLT